MATSDSSTPAREAASLIASDQASAMKVYAADGSKLGTIHNFIIAKHSGQVAYVVISTGGFLGLGQAYHPLPWSALKHDARQDGYTVRIDAAMLAGGPSYRPDSTPTFDDAYGRRIDDYYRQSPPIPAA